MANSFVSQEKGALTSQTSVRQPATNSYEESRRIREMRGFDMTQQDFAERIGITQNYFSTMEHGKVEIGSEILLRISRELGRKSIEWLLTG